MHQVYVMGRIEYKRMRDKLKRAEDELLQGGKEAPVELCEVIRFLNNRINSIDCVESLDEKISKRSCTP